jgi:hypothetical protein
VSHAPSTPLEAAAVGVRFMLELGALVAVGYWGAGTYPGVVGLAVGAGAALALAAAWGAFVSPKAPWRLPDPWRLAAELVAFALATVALAVGGQALLAVGYAVVAVADEAILLARDLR